MNKNLIPLLLILLLITYGPYIFKAAIKSFIYSSLNQLKY